MRFVIDSFIPFVSGKVESLGHSALYLPPSQITPSVVRSADALIIRTRTRCDASLLDGSRVRFIATATIGTDHIDFNYCRSHNIKVFSAPGCNAPGVAQYVLSVIGRLHPNLRSLGIVGVGHVGSIVRDWALANNINVMLCDPPRAAREGGADFVSLSEIARSCNVVTFHVPLDDSTRHIINHDFLSSLSPGALVINAARGAVADTDALLRHPEHRYCIDCWEHEPDISIPLLNQAVIATPHIAGYSLQGKRRASAIALNAILPELQILVDPIPQNPSLSQVISSYNPLLDTQNLKSSPSAFESLRNNYTYRPEP